MYKRAAFLIISIVVISTFFLFLQVAVFKTLSVKKVVPDGLKDNSFISFFSAKHEDVRRIGHEDTLKINGVIDNEIATFSLVSSNYNDNTIHLGLVSANFFNVLDLDGVKSQVLDSPQKIILSKEHGQTLGRTYQVNDVFYLNRDTPLIVTAIAPDGFKGISSGGEIGWIAHKGNELLYSGYPTVDKESRAELFRFAPEQLAFARVDASSIDAVRKALENATLRPAEYFQATESVAVKFGLEGYIISAREGMIYEWAQYQQEKRKAFIFIVASTLISIFVVFGQILSQLASTLKLVDVLKLEEILGAAPFAIFRRLMFFALIPVFPAFGVSVVSGLVLYFLPTGQLVFGPSHLNYLFISILVALVIALIIIVLSTSLSLLVYNNKKTMSLSQRASISLGELWMIRSSVLIQVVIFFIVVCAIILGIRESKTFFKQALGFEKSDLIYLSLREVSQVQNGVFNHIQSALINEPKFKNVKIASLVGAPGFGKAWSGQASINQKSTVSANMLFISRSFLDVVGSSLISGDAIDDSGAPGVLVNYALAKTFYTEDADELIGREININVMGVDIVKPIIGVVSDSYVSVPTVYFNGADKQGIVVEGDQFLIDFDGDVNELRDFLDRTLSPIGWGVGSLIPLEQMVQEMRPNLRNMNLIVALTSAALTLLIVYTMVVGIFHEITARWAEFKLKYYLGADIRSLIIELSRSSGKLILLGVSIGLVFIFFIRGFLQGAYPAVAFSEFVVVAFFSALTVIVALFLVIFALGFFGLNRLANPSLG